MPLPAVQPEMEFKFSLVVDALWFTLVAFWIGAAPPSAQRRHWLEKGCIVVGSYWNCAYELCPPFSWPCACIFYFIFELGCRWKRRHLLRCA